MEYKIFFNANYNTIKDIEEILFSEIKDIKKDSLTWNFTEETAVGFVRSSQNLIYYFSVPEGAKINFFSYKKVNQIIFITCDSAHYHVWETNYFRLLRRMGNKINRLKILAQDKEAELKQEMSAMFIAPTTDYHLSEENEFFFQLDNKNDQELFYNICRENQVKNLKFYSIFPVKPRNNELGESFTDIESLLFSGEILEKNLSGFIGSLMEEGLNLHKLTVRKINKLL